MTRDCTRRLEGLAMGGSAMSVGGEPRRRRGREPAGCGGVN